MKFNVLSLDGGGVRGIYSAALLAQYEKISGRKVAHGFDLIVGTSTGGILALGLGFGIDTERIVDFYRHWSPQIFPADARGWWNWPNWIFAAKYDPEPLRDGLVKVFGNQRLRDAPRTPKVMIPAFEGTTCEPVIFKTCSVGRKKNPFGEHSVVDVALATSAAPTYFPAANGAEGIMLDGGVWANCPAHIGAIEAIEEHRQVKEDIHVLSLGTTSCPISVTKEQHNGGLWHWVGDANNNIASLLIHASMKGALVAAKRSCKRLERIDTLVPPGKFKLDSGECVDELEKMGRKAAIDERKKLDSFFRGRDGMPPPPRKKYKPK